MVYAMRANELLVADVSPLDDAVRDFVPPESTSRSEKVALPEPFVEIGFVPDSVPAPLRVTLMGWPGTAVLFPKASRSWTTGFGFKITPAIPLLGWAVNASFAGAPGAMVNELLVADVKPEALALSVFVPIVSNERSLKVARPLALVLRISVPLSIPEPDALATVSATPLAATALPEASRSWTVTEGVIGDPAAAFVGC